MVRFRSCASRFSFSKNALFNHVDSAVANKNSLFYYITSRQCSRKWEKLQSREKERPKKNLFFTISPVDNAADRGKATIARQRTKKKILFLTISPVNNAVDRGKSYNRERKKERKKERRPCQHRPVKCNRISKFALDRDILWQKRICFASPP